MIRPNLKSQKIRGTIRTIVLMAILLSFFGCAIALVPGVGTLYQAVVDERPISRIIKDTAIKASVVSKLFEDDQVKVLDISTSCYRGKVYLIGEYETITQKERSIKLAKEVEGVTDVDSYLVKKVSSTNCGLTGNITISAKVKTALVKDGDVWSTNIDLKTIQCSTVVLWGLVGSQKEVNRAVFHAKSVAGVKKVESLLRISMQ